ncbi:MAG: hypothetical protein L7U87_09115 [Chlamydiales bacterium]|nr:hypothetical protein [Chlamydiales bacterium]
MQAAFKEASFNLHFSIPRKGQGSLSFTTEAIVFSLKGEDYSFSYSELKDTFCYHNLIFFTFKSSVKEGVRYIACHSSKERVSEVKCYLSELKLANLSKDSIFHCPSCGMGSKQESSSLVSYCPHCYQMFREGTSLNYSNGLYYNFTQEGNFTACVEEQSDRLLKNVSSYKLTFLAIKEYFYPTLEKLLAHSFWIVFWLSLYQFFLPQTFAASAIVFSLSFIHLFFAGYYLTDLLVVKAFSRLFKKTPYKLAISSIEKDPEAFVSSRDFKNYAEHPGMLVNTFFALKDQDTDIAYSYLEKAFFLCPVHPALKGLYDLYIPKNQKQILPKSSSL